MENSHLLYLAGEYTLPILMLFFKESSVFYTLFCSYDLFCNELFLFSKVANRLQHFEPLLIALVGMWSESKETKDGELVNWFTSQSLVSFLPCHT